MDSYLIEKQKPQTALLTRFHVSTDYTNAWSIARGLKRLGLVSTYSPPEKFASIQPDDWLFFTEEQSIEHFRNRADLKFLPRDFDFPIDDKVLFAKRVSEAGLAPIPLLAESGGDIGKISYPCVVKGRYSWHNGGKVPRGAACASLAEARSFLDGAAREGWKPEDFFLQAYLPDGVSNVVSVCGFFDWEKPQRDVILACRKLLSKRGGFGSSALAVEVIEDPANLLADTRRLLADFRYRGPFELEFASDADGCFYVLELNPRFWQQHGIFIRYFDNALIKRYLGRDTERDWAQFAALAKSGRKIVWCCGFGLILLVLPSRWSLLPFYLRQLPQMAWNGTRIMWDPAIPKAAMETLREVFGRFS